MKAVRPFIVAAAMTAVASPSIALETTASDDARTSVRPFEMKLNAGLAAMEAALNQLIDNISRCSNASKLWSPANPSADANGCIEVIPQNQVAAFNAASCPSGWAAFAPATNRFLVGSGNLYNLGATGGANSVQLTISQMPSHRHQTADNYSDWLRRAVPDSWGGAKSKVFMQPLSTVEYTNYEGGGAAHENRPPYVAVLFCYKL